MATEIRNSAVSTALPDCDWELCLSVVMSQAFELAVVLSAGVVDIIMLLERGGVLSTK